VKLEFYLHRQEDPYTPVLKEVHLNFVYWFCLPRSRITAASSPFEALAMKDQGNREKPAGRL